jgi:hypothetical protein
MNSSLQELDLSDNDLNDGHARLICNYIESCNESRDLELWESSLRQSEAEQIVKTKILQKNLTEVNNEPIA